MADIKDGMKEVFDGTKEYAAKGYAGAKEYANKILSHIDQKLDSDGHVVGKIKHKRTELKLGIALEAYLYFKDYDKPSVFGKVAAGALVPMLIDKLYRSNTWPYDFAYNMARLAVGEKNAYADGTPIPVGEQEKIIREALLSEPKYLETIRDVMRHDVAYDAIDMFVGKDMQAMPRVYFKDIISFFNSIPVIPDIPEGLQAKFGQSNIDVFGVAINIYDVYRLTGKWNGIFEKERPYIIVGTATAESIESALPTLSFASGWEFHELGKELLRRGGIKRPENEVPYPQDKTPEDVAKPSEEKMNKAPEEKKADEMPESEKKIIIATDTHPREKRVPHPEAGWDWIKIKY